MATLSTPIRGMPVISCSLLPVRICHINMHHGGVNCAVRIMAGIFTGCRIGIMYIVVDKT